MPERKQEKIFLWLEGTVERYGLVLAPGLQCSGKGLCLQGGQAVFAIWQEAIRTSDCNIIAGHE